MALMTPIHPAAAIRGQSVDYTPYYTPAPVAPRPEGKAQSPAEQALTQLFGYWAA